MLGRLEEAREAIAFLDGLPDPLIAIDRVRQATTASQEEGDHAPGEGQTTDPSHRLRIANLRARLRRDPRSAISWSELGRSYVAEGQLSKAERALSVGLALAPNNRYLIRNAACFFITTDQPDRAHAVVSAAPATSTDPWLIAAELTAAHVAGVPPRLVKRARSLLQGGDHSPTDLAEMASELGTLEMEHGAKLAKRMFAAALVAPNENSLAQVEWASHSLSGISPSSEQLEASSADEARSLHALQAGEWAEAFANAQAWQRDQFFSPKAAMVASYASAVGLMDWHESYRAAALGLQVHPDDMGLLNNAAYALVEAGDYLEAKRLLDRINWSRLTGGPRISCAATAGLLAFRTGDISKGREYYRLAIRRAAAQKDTASQAMASLMLAREEFRIQSGLWVAPLSDGVRLAGRVENAGLRSWIARLPQAATA